MAKVALVLSGCGVYDGSEVHEASACLVHLSRASASVSMFAPDAVQMHVIDHTKGEPMSEERNVLVESARIARGKVAPLADLRAADFDAVVFPGGFGAAKNLSDFAVKGPELTLIPDVNRVLAEFRGAQKPIGLCCIAPVLAAKAFGGGDGGVELTMGGEAEEGGKWPYAGATGAAKALGATHVPKDSADAAHVDAKNKVVTAPAYMCETAVHEIFDGIGKMVAEVLKLA